MNVPYARTLVAFGFPVLLLLACSSAWALDSAKLFKAQCASCHGAKGGGNVSLLAPPLAGLDAEYLTRQLRNFRSKVRGGDAAQGPSATMQAIAQSLSDDAAVLGLAQYIAKLNPVAFKEAPLPSGGSLNAGKSLFGVCVSCHGAQGEGNTSLGAPRLTHLPGWYMRNQLNAYRQGLRGTHEQDREGRQMRQIATEVLSDEEAVVAVAAYIATLGQRAR